MSFGIRSVTLIRKSGHSFHFTINGLPFFVKGANQVPHNYFLPTGLRDPTSYQDLIDSAVRANFNMVRVWGGGHYELETYYEQCDRAGLMIWQDFMFANTIYPHS